ncbi:MAG: hypothetical protein JW829_10080 [Pirellulales bacterium]|nr:hypothetical protein [Pirellulales bacterium]
MRHDFHIGIVILGIAVVASTWPAQGQDFRIETAVYEKDTDKPVTTTVTLFESGVVYDFLSEPNQVAVFRPAAGDQPGRFVLLNVDQEIRTELATDQIDGLLKKLKMWSTMQSDPFQKFLAAPKFDEEYDSATGILTLTADAMTYRVETAHGGEAPAMAIYREFSDWYARLNTVTQNAMLPFARLQLNAALDARGRVPTKVHLLVPDQDLDLRAEHTFTWRISRTDRQRIDEVQRQLRQFKLVDNETFRK